MQTFLPYANFKKSAQALDKKRLNKQRVEAFQVLKAITDPTYGWQHHPAVKQWVGHVGHLAAYGLAIHHECDQRGIADNQNWRSRFLTYELSDDQCIRPVWLGIEDFHYSHRCNLTRKDPEHYGAQWDADPSVPYWWPTKELV